MQEELNEDDEYLSKDNEDTNSTTSTSKTSSSNPKRGKRLPVAAASNGVSGAKNPPNPVYDFTMQALEMSLYGYLRQTDPMFASHAISGLRIPLCFRAPSEASGLDQMKMVQSDLLKRG